MKDRIKQLMDAQHMNQQTFANYTGIGTASLSSIFTGRTRPTLNHVDAIMEKFPDVNPLWLLKGQGGMFQTVADNLAQTDGTSVTPSVNSATASDTTPGSDGPRVQSLGFFDADNMAEQQHVATPHRTSVTPAMNAPKSGWNQPAQQPSLQPMQPLQQRKITEIRIFYDDQTWETFVPKNK